jgi:hypothetical protein
LVLAVGQRYHAETGDTSHLGAAASSETGDDGQLRRNLDFASFDVEHAKGALV